MDRLPAAASEFQTALTGASRLGAVEERWKALYGLGRVAQASENDESARAYYTQAAAAIELTHLATLFHDDVMDEAAIRRGLQSANSRWSNTIAILTGDFLFARASAILAELGAEAIRIQA